MLDNNGKLHFARKVKKKGECLLYRSIEYTYIVLCLMSKKKKKKKKKR